MKKYWLTLSQDTFLWLKEKEGCVYNTITHRAFSFEKTDVLIPIVDTLLQIQNLYADYPSSVHPHADHEYGDNN